MFSKNQTNSARGKACKTSDATAKEESAKTKTSPKKPATKHVTAANNSSKARVRKVPSIRKNRRTNIRIDAHHPPPIDYPSDPRDPRLLLPPPHLLQYAPVIWDPNRTSTNSVSERIFHGVNNPANRMNHFHEPAPIANHRPMFHLPQMHNQQPRAPIRFIENANLIMENDEPMPPTLVHNQVYTYPRSGPIRLVGREGNSVSLIRNSPSPCL